MKVEGKVALVVGAGATGSSKTKLGNGRAAAIALAREGASVVAADICIGAAEQTVEMIRKLGGDSVAVQGDVSKDADVQRMIETTLSCYGKLDILDNNVGIVLQKDIIEISDEEWDRVLAVNLKGMFLASKYAVLTMMKSGGGSIINIASVAGLLPFPGMAAYSISKSATITLTRCTAIECGRYGIRVNCVVPGVIDTPLLDVEVTPAGKEERTRRIPLQRLGQAEEVAQAVLFFASEESTYITGAVLTVDGGFTAGASPFWTQRECSTA